MPLGKDIKIKYISFCFHSYKGVISSSVSVYQIIYMFCVIRKISPILL